MSSKTGGKAWSMGARMAAWYAGSAAVLLIVATTSLYVTIASGLETEADRWLVFGIDYLKKYQLRTGKLLPGPEDWETDDLRIRDESGKVLFETRVGRNRLPKDLVPGTSGVNYFTANGRWYRALARRVDGRIYEVAFDRTRELELLRR
ncbi:hypothetical protein ACYOEI_21120 [Singulisphaera rosea]